MFKIDRDGEVEKEEGVRETEKNSGRQRDSWRKRETENHNDKQIPTF